MRKRRQREARRALEWSDREKAANRSMGFDADRRSRPTLNAYAAFRKRTSRGASVRQKCGPHSRGAASNGAVVAGPLYGARCEADGAAVGLGKE